MRKDKKQGRWGRKQVAALTHAQHADKGKASAPDGPAGQASGQNDIITAVQRNSSSTAKTKTDKRQLYTTVPLSGSELHSQSLQAHTAAAENI